MIDLAAAHADFERALNHSADADDAYRALQGLAQTIVGVRLFTVMTVDLVAGVARRAYSSNPQDYPVSGTKPIIHDDWFDGVSRKRKPFVANTLADIAKVFADHALIGALGCGSVINIPIFIDEAFVATVNLLHEQHHYTDERILLAVGHLTAAGEAVMRRTLRL